MARRRRRLRRWRLAAGTALLLTGVAYLGWIQWRVPSPEPPVSPEFQTAALFESRSPSPVLSGSLDPTPRRRRRDLAPPGPALQATPATASDPIPVTNLPSEALDREKPATTGQGTEDPWSTLVEQGRQSLSSGDLLGARERLAEAFRRPHEKADPTSAAELRERLSALGREMIFSPRLVTGDPLVRTYVIQPGDSLGRIATNHRVSAELLARVNSIVDKNRIRAGQTLKVILGPFRSEVGRTSYTLDLFLQDTLVSSFPVGLGADDSTPSGEWQVGTKLVNPTYYPPRGGQILSADDPKNPLGERWIGLVGVGGGAVGQLRYGIHGTIEPESIGRNASLGCIRMRNEDVEFLYDCLVEKQSIVIVR